jgi:hypothetical protein
LIIYFLAEIVVQILIVFVGGAVFQVTHIGGREWGITPALGVVSIPLGALVRLTPDVPVEKLSHHYGFSLTVTFCLQIRLVKRRLGTRSLIPFTTTSASSRKFAADFIDAFVYPQLSQSKDLSRLAYLLRTFSRSLLTPKNFVACRRCIRAETM